MRRVLIVAHREELIWQGAATARKAGLSVGVEMGGHRAGNEAVIVSTIQTLIAKSKCKSCRGAGCEWCEQRGHRLRMERFKPEEFGAVIVDEAHHSCARSYRLVLKYFSHPQLKKLLVTATPKRADKVGLHNVCESVAYEMDLRTAIAEGWLCPIRQRFVTCEDLDLSRVKTKAGGDLADGELERAFLGDSNEQEERLLHEVVAPALEEAKGQSMLVFATGVEHARKLTAAFNAYDGVTAELVVQDTDKEERKRIIERYKSGDVQVLVGVGVFTEGFDAPGTAVVAVCRQTKSESLYLQMIGRGTRPLPGLVDGVETATERMARIAGSAKPHCLVLDFVGNSGQHKLVSVGNILAGDDVEPVDLESALKAARKAAEPVDIEALIEKAKEAREAREKRKAEREARKRESTHHKADSADYTAEDVDLFGGGSFDSESAYKPAPGGASEKQVAYLVKLGVKPETAATYTKRQAGIVIDKLTNASGADFRVSFGKYAGKRLADVPKGYVVWAINNLQGPRGDAIRKNWKLMHAPVREAETVPF